MGVSPRVDLRVRGGDVTTREPSAPVVGRSPRARRRLGGELRVNRQRGSISACAEETTRPPGSGANRRVDLRVRGGDERLAAQGQVNQGRSPRARRRHQRGDGSLGCHGSISACAEETRACNRRMEVLRVDLRVRGGDARCRLWHGGIWGRSPRARRSPIVCCRRSRPDGSISACAEETRPPRRFPAR